MKSKMTKKKVYAFIDSQNLNLGVKSMGWSLDWRKFRQYLRNKYDVQKAYMFIGQVAGNESLYTHLQEAGFILVFKPVMEYKREGKRQVKGNVDAELVLHAMIHFPDYDMAVIVSGDGDFYCLVEYLEKQKKLSKLLTPTKKYSSLLRRFNNGDYIARIDLLKDSLKYKK